MSEDNDPLAGPGSEALVRRVIDIINSARPMPLSSSVMIGRDEVAELLEQAVEQLPQEIRRARWLLKEREEYLAQAQAEATAIVGEASGRAEQMVQRTEVVRAAETRARQVVEQAEGEARALRHEAEDFADQRLAQFEIVLAKTAELVENGRQRLRGNVEAEPDITLPEADAADDGAFFDQDQE